MKKGAVVIGFGRKMSCLGGRCSVRGFSLVELMVGVTIGLIATLLMTQVIVFYDGQKRGTTSGADAQNTGAVALFTLENDLRQAGYGMATLDTLACSVQSSGDANGRRIYPALIIPDGMAAAHANNALRLPPGDAGSDILVVMFSNAVTAAEGVSIANEHIQGNPGYNPRLYVFGRNITGFRVGDTLLVGQAGQSCTVTNVTAVTAATLSVTTDHPSTGAAYAANTARVFNLGNNGLVMRAYAVRGGNLTVCDLVASDCSADLSGLTVAQRNVLWVPIASNVVGLRAQYGWDTTAAADMRVDAYCRSRLTPGAANCPTPDDGMTGAATVPSTACDFTRITSLRVALVTQGAELARDTTNPTAATINLWPTISGAAVAAPVTVGPAFAVPSQRYRYKVFNTTVPIRNVIWFGGQSSC